VYGIHPCASLLAYASRRVHRAYVYRGAGNGDEASVLSSSLVPALERAGVPIIRTDKNTLANMANQGLHQGIVLEADAAVCPEIEDGLTPAQYLKLASRDRRQRPVAAASEAATQGEPLRPAALQEVPLLVALDEVQDPHNLGAVLRSAWLLGANGVVVSARNSAPLNATVSKTSSGALEGWVACRLVHATRSMPTFLGAAAAAGWRVLGTSLPPARVLRQQHQQQQDRGQVGEPEKPAPAADGANAADDAESSHDDGAGFGAHAGGMTPPAWTPSHALRRDVATILVLGSEGRGMRTNVRRACTAFTYIPMLSAPPATVPQPIATNARPASVGAVAPTRAAMVPLPVPESLNVSTAAAVLLHQLATHL
jgi:tRNA G18 (ribose-2'-O)-methylase SpoU